MGAIKERMIRDMEIRGLSANTKAMYLDCVSQKGELPGGQRARGSQSRPERRAGRLLWYSTIGERRIKPSQIGTVFQYDFRHTDDNGPGKGFDGARALSVVTDLALTS